MGDRLLLRPQGRPASMRLASTICLAQRGRAGNAGPPPPGTSSKRVGSGVNGRRGPFASARRRGGSAQSILHRRCRHAGLIAQVLDPPQAQSSLLGDLLDLGLAKPGLRTCPGRGVRCRSQLRPGDRRTTALQTPRRDLREQDLAHTARQYAHGAQCSASGHRADGHPRCELRNATRTIRRIRSVECPPSQR